MFCRWGDKSVESGWADAGRVGSMAKSSGLVSPPQHAAFPRGVPALSSGLHRLLLCLTDLCGSSGPACLDTWPRARKASLIQREPEHALHTVPEWGGAVRRCKTVKGEDVLGQRLGGVSLLLHLYNFHGLWSGTLQAPCLLVVFKRHHVYASGTD